MKRSLPVLLALSSLIACNVPPEAPVIAFTPEAPSTTDDITVTIAEESFDQNGDPVSYEYEWTVNGQPSNRTGPTISAADTSKKQRWQVTVTPTDGTDLGPSVSASIEILNTPPQASVSIAPDAPDAIEDLVATADGTDEDGDALSFSYSWTRDGTPTGITGDTVPADETARGQRWEVHVTPNDGDEDGAIASASVDINNVAPVATEVLLSPLTPGAADTLTASAVGTDVDGDSLSWSYAWEVNGSAQDGTDSSFSGGLAKGDSVQVFATPNDGFVDGEARASNTVVIVNTPPSATGVRIAPTSLDASSSPRCAVEGYSDVDADPDQSRYEWRVDGSVVGGGESLTAPITKGQRVQCVVTPYDGEDEGEPISSAVLVVKNTPPVLASASLSPSTPREGDTISVTLGSTSDADGDDVSLEYAWTVNGSSAGSAATLGSSSFDKDDEVQVTVTPFDGDERGTPVVTAKVTVANTPPVITSASLSDTAPRTSDTISVSTVSSDADADTISLSYAWTVNGATISASGSTLSGEDWFDKKDSIEVTVTPSDGDDTGTPRVLKATAINTLPTAPEVSLPSSPSASTTLVCKVDTASTDIDGDSITYRFVWQRNGSTFSSTSTTTFTGDTISSSHTRDGDTWQCTATPNDGDGNGPSDSATVKIGRPGDTRDSAVKDCKTLKSIDSTRPSGTYWIDPDGDTDHSDAFQAWCDQSTAGGGWTLAWYVDAAHFDGFEGNNMTAQSTAPTKINGQKDVWNAEATMSFSETLYACTTQNDASTYYWRYNTKNPHTYMASTTTDYAYQSSVPSAASNTTAGGCMATHKGGSGRSYGFMVIMPSSCGSCSNIHWGMYHYSSGGGCNSTSTTYGRHTSPWRSASIEYPICNKSQTSNGKFWIGVR